MLSCRIRYGRYHVPRYNLAVNLKGWCFSVSILLSGLTAFSLAASDVKWGSIQDDLQLGIAWSGSSNSATTVRVLLKNAGPKRREISVGYEGSAGSFYNVEITALSNAQPRREERIFDLNALKAKPQGLAVPKVVVLEPGGVYVFAYPLSQLISVINRQDVALQDLLKRGYSIRAALKVSGHGLLSPDLEPGEK